MPYSNEHSARLQDPKKFDKDTFRRTAGGKIYGSKKVPKTIGIIWAKLTGRSKASDFPHPQSLRFPIKNWTVTKAKKWLKKNNITYVRFEPAKPEEKNSMSAKDKNTVSLQECLFSDCAEVSFAEKVNEQDKDKFRITGYSGEVLKHCYWGNIAFDLSALKFAKARVPVLESHDRTSRIGFSTKKSITDTVVVEGEFLKNQRAQELKSDLQGGFPMEASLLVVPSVIEHVKEGNSLEVNGHKLKGPGTVFRKAVIKEVSMCVFGVDSHTSSQALSAKAGASEEIKFSVLDGDNQMSKEMTIEEFASAHPDIFEQAVEKGRADGEKNERDMFSELEVACGSDHELLLLCYKEGKTTEEALQMRSEKLEKANAELTAKVSAFEAAPPVAAKKDEEVKVDPAENEFSDDASKVPAVKPTGEEAMKAEFANSVELQDEYKTEEAYLAYCKQAKAGRVRILSKK